MKNQIFIYLARRDKKGIKCLFNFPYKTKVYPTKIDNIENFQFSNEIKSSLYLEFEKNKFLYELYMESANSYNDLKQSLIKRGYKNLPLQQISLKLMDSNQNINENFLVTKNSTMLRKKTDQA
jgi:hypothetical protein